MGGEAVVDSASRRCPLVADAVTQSSSTAALEVDTEEHLVASSQSAISDAIVNAEAFADIAGVAAVAMETDPSASAVVVVVCICA